MPTAREGIDTQPRASHAPPSPRTITSTPKLASKKPSRKPPSKPAPPTPAQASQTNLSQAMSLSFHPQDVTRPASPNTTRPTRPRNAATPEHAARAAVPAALATTRLTTMGLAPGPAGRTWSCPSQDTRMIWLCGTRRAARVGVSIRTRECTLRRRCRRG